MTRGEGGEVQKGERPGWEQEHACLKKQTLTTFILDTGKKPFAHN